MTINAQYSGLCIPCGEDILPGHSITLNAEHGYIHEECTDIQPAESNGADFDSFNPGRTPGIPVLPRGKTSKDRCNTCFIVHAPGQDGCE